MPQTLFHNQFDAGWIPSDDSINGRKNGLLKMDNLELNKNGALSLGGGCSKVGSSYGTNIHTLESYILGGSRVDYAGGASGAIFRNRTSIFTGGSTTKMAVGSAYDFALLASGDVRKKDTGSGTAKNLGITAPTTKPTILLTRYDTPTLKPQTFAVAYGDTVDHSVTDQVTITTVVGDDYTTVVESTDALSKDFTDFTADGGQGPNWDSETDTYNIVLYGDTSIIDFFVLDILLEAPDGTGSVQNKFSYDYNPTAKDTSVASDEGYKLTLTIPRNKFIKRGSDPTLGWTAVKGLRFSYRSTTATSVIVSYVNSYMLGGKLPLRKGRYEYCQIDVYKNGAYTGKSTMGPISYVDIGDDATYAATITTDSTGMDSQVNETWVFRRGGLLDQWYRVKVVTSPYAAFLDNLEDIDAIAVNVTLNTNLVSANSTGLSDAILDIVGPIQGRWYYFTDTFFYPTDINNPDLIDTTKGVRLTGSNNEKFLWARQIAEAAVLVGTTKNIYLLSGTFITYPDFSVDAYYRPMGCKHPPVTYDAAVYNAAVYYLAADGWRSFDASGNDVLLTAFNTDRLYRGETVQGYLSMSPGFTPNSTRYPCAIANNKLYCGIGSSGRIEVLDFTRKYWRNISYGVGNVTAICNIPSGGISLTMSSDNIQRDIDLRSTFQVDATTSQTVTILTPVLDAGMPRNRKDGLTLKARLVTNAANLAVSVITDDGTSTSLGNLATASTTVLEKFLDAGTLPVSRTYQFSLTGSFTVFELQDISVDFEPRPTLLSRMIIRATNFGNPGKKRVRTWPHKIDTLGYDVVFTPNVDGTNTATSTFNSTYPKTSFHQFLTDVFGVDYGGVLTCEAGEFEYYEGQGGNPEIVHVLPAAIRFDQVGPAELIRYGKLLEFEFRLLAYGTSIPYNIIFSDNKLANGVITTKYGEEWTYSVPVPKGMAGQILRIELGPTAFDFHRYYCRAKIARSGNDTQNEWIQLGQPGA
jgi:hypothetical protein